MSTAVLSKETLEVLGNYASINPNLLVKPGKKLATIATARNVFTEAEIAEEIPCEFGIYDLGIFLATVGLFKEPELVFGDKFVTIQGKGDAASSVRFYFSEPTLLSTPSDKPIKFPAPVASFDLTEVKLLEVIKGANTLRLPDLAVEATGGKVHLVAIDKKNPTSNKYSVEVCENKSGTDFKKLFRIENIKILNGNYTVEVCAEPISRFTHKTRKVVYYIAVERDSN